ncbi:MAG: hypothetical protein DRJ31_07980 [Candidatus Methanomethylicota archaeon]|uniref:Peptidase M20 dimerisation domain-containing protein n=1 Tax=Thermoproteota archaeon TaxID=2056631 RepID=A0A497F2X6_9CREN|nr:MAG: hypothetical protein DRJ31_07980 [Candidatus Verstraetearchaeota archaeon]RLE53659.1 MAG: hypothetical protein DRJ33_00380 [Candidatus Verstraetearchaeota archaeon]
MSKIPQQAVLELKDLLQSLVATRSVEPCSYLIESYLSKLNAKCRKLYVERDEPMLISLINSPVPSTPLIFTAHIDVAPIGSIEKWSFNPFSGEVEEETLKGRGSVDAKAGIAALLVALKLALEAKEPLKQDIYILILPDGERLYKSSLRMIGGAGLPPSSKLIILEPTSLKVAISCIGSYRVMCSIRGKLSHVGIPSRQNPIYATAAFINSLGSLLSEKVSIVSVGTPYWETTTPDTVSLILHIAAKSREEAEKLYADMIQLLRDAGLEYSCSFSEELSPLAQDKPGKLALTLLSHLRDLGLPSEITTSNVATPAKAFLDMGLADEAVIFGPGDPSKIHEVDESINMREVELACAALYKLMLRGLV